MITNLHTDTRCTTLLNELPTATHSDRSISDVFVSRILTPYQALHADYLRTASVVSVGSHSTQKEEPIITTHGRYCIPSSCYIQSTGHFNAVEFLICYNQLAYVTFGYLIDHGILTSLPAGSISKRCRTALQDLSIEKFFSKQLSSMFILKTESRFRRAIDPRDFYCDLEVSSVLYRQDTFFTDTRCRFSDAAGGEADGSVLLAYPLRGN